MSSFNINAVIAQFDAKIWRFHFLVPDDIAKTLIENGNRRVICNINKSHRFHCALMPSKTKYFILVNAEIRKKLKLNIDSPVFIELEIDKSEFGMPMPEEFKEVLEQDDLAREYFLSLTAGKQRTLLYLIGKIKNTDIRIKKSLAIMHHLCINNGILDLNLLSETMKEFNKNR